ncbi:MAG: C40 family peptidase [Saprospiraceae bacterium]|nr:C40 family peptidase [Saprospiraceae bacterium]
MNKIILSIIFCVGILLFANEGFATIPPVAPPSSPTFLDFSFLRQDVVSYAKEWVGSRYRSGSRRPEVGFDCSGFTNFVMKKFNIKISHCSNSQINEGEAISLEMTRPGDLLFFGYRGHVSHVAMVVSNDENGIIIVHSTSSRGVVVENVNESSYWTNKLICARNVIDEKAFDQINNVASAEASK